MPNYFRSALYGDSPVHTSSVTIPKKILDEVGLFNPTAIIGEDGDLWGRIAIKYPVVFSWYIGETHFLDANNRISNCQVFEHPFVKTIQVLLMQNKLPEALKNDIIEYSNLVQLNQAARALFKACQPLAARKILKGLYPNIAQLRRRRKLLLLLSYLKCSQLRFLWRIWSGMSRFG